MKTGFIDFLNNNKRNRHTIILFKNIRVPLYILRFQPLTIPQTIPQLAETLAIIHFYVPGTGLEPAQP